MPKNATPLYRAGIRAMGLIRMVLLMATPAALQAFEAPSSRSHHVTAGHDPDADRGDRGQISLPRVELFATTPEPFHVFDWAARTREFNTLLFSPAAAKSGMRWLAPSDTPLVPRRVDACVSYANESCCRSPVPGPSNGLALWGAVLGAAVARLDHNATRAEGATLPYLDRRVGIFLGGYGTSPAAGNVGPGHSFWGDLAPNIWVLSISDLYPECAVLRNRSLQAIDRWLIASEVMGWNFKYTAFNFTDMKPVSNGHWLEADAAAAVGWLALMGHEASGKSVHLKGAVRAIAALEATPFNPFYELLLPYGVIAAARLNAQHGHVFNVTKLLNWCFDTSTKERSQWGAVVGRWGNKTVDGLIGSSSDGGGYAFAGNVFWAASALSPVARYDHRFADVLGKWLVAIAVGGRFFYQDHLGERQSMTGPWTNDPQQAIPYEGVRKCDFSRPAGKCLHGEGYGPFGTGQNCGDCGVKAGSGRCGSCWHLMHGNLTDLGLYGGAFVGLMGGLVQSTDNPHIPQFDLLANDRFPPRSYPTVLLYNALQSPQQVRLNTSAAEIFTGRAVDLYETTSDQKLATAVLLEQAVVVVPPYQAVVVVVLPAHSTLQRRGGVVSVNSTVIRYHTKAPAVKSDDTTYLSPRFHLDNGAQFQNEPSVPLFVQEKPTIGVPRSQRLKTEDLASPSFHFWPSAVSSQDISGPIGIVDPSDPSNKTLTWHIFVDCNGPGVAGTKGGGLNWCHFSSRCPGPGCLVKWTEHDVAIRHGNAFDARCIDTGSVWQHPNGTVYATYATINGTSNSMAGAVDGDICLARALDSNLTQWTKLCEAIPAGKIRSPICDWCRFDCPISCKHMQNSSRPSPFPGILGRGGHRDPPAPWLDGCSSSSDPHLCWFQPVASGGTHGQVQGQPAPAITLFKNTLALDRPWEAVRYPAQPAPILWWNSHVQGGPPEYSCPDIASLPGSDLILFYSLTLRYMLTRYQHTNDTSGPTLTGVAPYSNFDGPPFAFSGGSPEPAKGRNWGLSGMNIAKSGGIGPNNALGKGTFGNKRRVLWGTMPLPDSSTLPCRSSTLCSSHLGTIVTLPRDLNVVVTPDKTPRLGARFVPELQQLRVPGTHRTITNVDADGTIPSGRSTELIVQFGAHTGAKSYGVVLLDDGHGRNVSVLYDPIHEVLRPSPCYGRGPGNSSAARQCLMPLHLADTEQLFMHIYIDEGFVEFCVNNQSIIALSTVSSASANRLVGGVGASKVESWTLQMF